MTPAERKRAREKYCCLSATELRAYTEAGILPMVDEESYLMRRALDALDERDALLWEVVEVCPYDVMDGPPGEEWQSDRWKALEAKIRAVIGEKP